MSEGNVFESIQTILALINDYYRETVATTNEEAVTERVMALFRNEDLHGIKELMEKNKLEQDFFVDLQQFLRKWSARIGSSGK